MIRLRKIIIFILPADSSGLAHFDEASSHNRKAHVAKKTDVTSGQQPVFLKKLNSTNKHKNFQLSVQPSYEVPALANSLFSL